MGKIYSRKTISGHVVLSSNFEDLAQSQVENVIADAEKYNEKPSDMSVLKQVVLKSAELREASWIEAHSCYGINLQQASIEAVAMLGFDKDIAYPAYLLLTTTWNDVIDWANGEHDE